MKRAFEQMKLIEKKLIDGESLYEPELEALKKELLKFESSENKSLLKLAELSKSLSTDISLEKLMHFIVPLERLLKKRVTDTDLIVNSEDAKRPSIKHDLIIVLDNIRSAFNTGALYRTCEATGVQEVVITGYTQGFESEQVVKTSMGARPKIIRLRDIKEVLGYLKGYSLVALETTNQSQPIYNFDLKKKTAFVLGNERFGLSEADLLLCDQIVSLPTFGLKNSLNVNAALSACAYEWVRRFSE